MNCRIFQIILVIIFFINKIANAGPPYISDDPDSIEKHHYEVYFFSLLDKNNIALEEPKLLSPAVELDWGAAPDVQLHLIVPYAWSLSPLPAARGPGDIEAGVKYRFVHETKNRPQVGFYPLLELPAGSGKNHLGNGKLWMKLPIWLQKKWGSWSSIGGGGYVLNPAYNMRNYPYGGWILQKELNEHWVLGIELYSQGPFSVQSRPFTILNAGGSYHITKYLSLLFAAGHSILGDQHIYGYSGLLWTGEG